MRDLLEKTLNRFEELERQLVDPVILSDSPKLTAAIREHGSLNRLATKYRRFKELNVEIAEAREMAEGDDLDMRELAEAELPGLIEAREELWNELLTLTLGGGRGAGVVESLDRRSHRRAVRSDLFDHLPG